MSMFGLWSSGSPTPKRSNTLKPAPLTPKLTTTTSPSPEYPSHTTTTHDAQQPEWEHVKHASSSSPDGDDEGTFENLAYVQVAPDTSRAHDRARGSLPPVPAPAQWQEERERFRQQLEASIAAQRRAESDRDKWERKVIELRSTIHSEKDGGSSSSRSRRERERDKEREKESAVTDALKEENEKLRSMLRQHTQQLEAAREETKQERSRLQSDAEKLRGELNAARGTHKEEVEALKASLQEHTRRIEYLTVDRERTRKERDSAKADLGAETDRLKQTHAQEIEQFKSVLEETSRERAQAQSELRKARKSLDAYAQKLDENHREIDELRRQVFSAKESDRTATELKQRLDIQNKELFSAREESSTLRKEFDQLLALLEDRTSELKGAQSFLSTADTFSGVEVTNTLQRLNAEVLQSTAFMAESMVEVFFDETTRRASKTDEQLAACKRASAAIGAAIVHFLGTKKHGDDPILIQIAFQAYLTYRLRWIARAWIISGDEAHNRFIDSIYQSVHGKEAQAIAGRWRALTRAHVSSTPLDDSQFAFQIANKMVIPGLADILLATGCTAPKQDVASALTTKFAEKLSFLVSMAIRVNKIVGEDVTSGDFEVLAVPPATAFDVATMEDSYDDGRSAKATGGAPPKVLCATDLGLRKTTRVATTGEKQWETKVMLKPKVALESVVEIMDE